jgi:hypothetical protein
MEPLFDQARHLVRIGVTSDWGGDMFCLILFDGRKEVEVSDQPLGKLKGLRVVSMALVVDLDYWEDEEEEEANATMAREKGILRFHSLRSFSRRCP